MSSDEGSPVDGEKRDQENQGAKENETNEEHAQGAPVQSIGGNVSKPPTESSPETTGFWKAVLVSKVKSLFGKTGSENNIQHTQSDDTSPTGPASDDKDWVKIEKSDATEGASTAENIVPNNGEMALREGDQHSGGSSLSNQLNGLWTKFSDKISPPAKTTINIKAGKGSYIVASQSTIDNADISTESKTGENHIIAFSGPGQYTHTRAPGRLEKKAGEEFKNFPNNAVEGSSDEPNHKKIKANSNESPNPKL